MEYIPVSEKAKHHIQFWKTWVKSEACFLTKKEIIIIEYYTFKTLHLSANLLSSFKMENQIKFSERLNEEQKTEYNNYKDRIILNFLSGILKIAESGSKETFMQAPISQFEILNDIKNSLSKSNIHTFHDFFDVITEDEMKI